MIKHKDKNLTCSKHNRILIGKNRCLDCKPMHKKKVHRLHKIGRHGAVGFVTSKGSICAECGKPIKEVSYTEYKKNGEKIPKSFIKRLYKFFIKT